MLLCARSCSENFIHINSFNHQNLGSLSASIIPLLLMKTPRQENSNPLLKKTHQVGSKGSILTQAIWHHSQHLRPSHSVACLEVKIMAGSVRTVHWKTNLIHWFASNTSFCCKKDSVSGIILVLDWLDFHSVHIEKWLARTKICLVLVKILFSVTTEVC